MEKNYTDSYVAFLDILGFKEYVSKTECSQIYDLLEKCQNDAKWTAENENSTLDVNSLFSKVKLNLISDSMVISIPAAQKGSLDILIVIVCMITMHCITEYGVFLRGAITKGNLFSDNSKVFGPALNQAYILESQSAVYPRIIFTTKLLNEYKEHFFEPSFDIVETTTDIDDDFYQIVDYMMFFHWQIKRNIKAEQYESLLSKIDRIIDDKLESEYNNRVREKYIWLKKYSEKSKLKNQNMLSKLCP